MKKFWTILLALVFAAAFCAYAQAGILDGYQELLKAVEKAAAPEMITSGNYEYYVSEETAVIANYFGDEESLEIPAQIDGYDVTGIGDGAFSYLEMKSVFFPDSVRSIGKRAFEYCTITDQLNLPDNITIGEDAFSYAAFSSPVVIPAGATVEKCAFSYCEGLQQVEIGAGAVIKSRAFGYCDDLEQVVCADGSVVEEDAFEYCPKLEEPVSGGEAQTEDTAPSSEGLVTGEYLYLALGDEKLARIKEEPPVELSFHVDQGGYGRTAVFNEGEALDQAVELLCQIKIGEESGEWVTDNYNWISLEWEDGSGKVISLNLRNLEYMVQSVPYTYKLENLDEFWSYCAQYLEEDTAGPAPGSEQPGNDEGNAYDEAVIKAIDLIRDAWQAEADEYPQMMEKPYADIKNTRIIEIADKPVNADMENKPVDELKDVDYIIEFMMLTNYFGDSLPVNAGILDTVAVYRSGKMEVQKSNLLNALRAKYFMTDYSGVIDEIIDFGDTYSGQLFE